MKLVGYFSFFVIPMVALLTAGMPARGQTQAVGEAERVVNTVTGAGVAGDRRLATADLVYRDENIAAAADSRGEIELMDGSRILVDANSVVTLDNFVIADNSFASGTFSVSKGAFRLITGRAKGLLNIRTPLSNIGIRGSIVDVYVYPASTFVINLAGILQVCTIGGQCILMDRVCDIVEITSRTQIDERPFLYSNRRSRAEEAATFHLSEQQMRHGARWRAPMGGCTQRAAAQIRERWEDSDPDASPSITPQFVPPDPPSRDNNPDGCNGCEGVN